MFIWVLQSHRDMCMYFKLINPSSDILVSVTYLYYLYEQYLYVWHKKIDSLNNIYMFDIKK